MKNFWVDFAGYCLIPAESKEEAEDKFWEIVNQMSDKGVFGAKDSFGYDDVWEVTDIESDEPYAPQEEERKFEPWKLLV